MSGRVSDTDDTNQKKYVTFKVHHEDPFRFTIAYTDESPDELYEQFVQKIASIGRPVGKLYYVDRGTDHMLISNARDLKNAMEGCELMNIHATAADTDVVTSRSPFCSGGDEAVRRRHRGPRRHCRHPSPNPRMCYQSHGHHGPHVTHGCPAFAAEPFPWGPCSFYAPHFGQFGCTDCCCHQGVPYSCCCSF
ncbi:unnamed protein product [Haemonchus placei]|uniref:PB1 domain-containing protein n=1 Tax=Haemonchus placei TaxID=6290 RepID=A0A0N4W5Q4_HAEPC|nr:unnamed protein product [Haemonchus placei]